MLGISHISLTSTLTFSGYSKWNNLVVKDVRMILVTETKRRDELTKFHLVSDGVLQSGKRIRFDLLRAISKVSTFAHSLFIVKYGITDSRCPL